MKKVNIDEKWKKNIFWDFPEKYGQMSKKVKNNEKGSVIAERGLNGWKMKKK